MSELYISARVSLDSPGVDRGGDVWFCFVSSLLKRKRCRRLIVMQRLAELAVHRATGLLGDAGGWWYKCKSKADESKRGVCSSL